MSEGYMWTEPSRSTANITIEVTNDKGNVLRITYERVRNAQIATSADWTVARAGVRFEFGPVYDEYFAATARLVGKGNGEIV